MKTIHKLKQSTSNFKNHFVRDSKVIVAGTLFMFMLFGAVNVSAVSYKIVYDDNVVSGMPEDVRSTTMNDSENISSDKPTRDGYSFLKWCTKVPASDGTCGGAEYTAGAPLPIVGTSKNEYSLYAMWKEVVPTVLYDAVAAMSKGTQTAADLQAAITKDNSGVYEYNSSVFGTSSDASNDNKIYYYRGILDETVGSYGSDGDNKTWPNTVVLSAATNKAGLTTSDTCWRIVRTTGSGGVKMVYSGKWTGSTCANKQYNTQVKASAYNSAGSGSSKSIVKVGYTFNNNYTTTTTSTQAGTLFGTNSSYSGNSTNSTIKTYIEDTWFSNINDYASLLEANAGYCNDRSVNTGSTWTTYSDTTSITTPYTTATSGITAFYFGPYVRTYNSGQKPTLACARNTVDLYTTSSASAGNKQLSKPAALLTADELNFAGSGAYSNGSGVYNANSYLRSGSTFWLLSPYFRRTNGYASEFFLVSGGNLNYNHISDLYGVRPAISLNSGTEAASGSGTAEDPWIVIKP